MPAIDNSPLIKRPHRLRLMCTQISLVLCLVPAYAEDFTPLSLEELLEIEITRREPLGIHHSHQKGELMLSIAHMSMSMSDNFDGSSTVSTAQVLADFKVAPIHMQVETTVLGVMYSPNDDWTLMAMLPYSQKSMDHINRQGTKFTTHANGIGDLSMSALYSLRRDKNSKTHLQIGLRAPTGSIDKRDDTALGRKRLPYTMQLGSGTWDVTVGATYQQVIDKTSFGVNASALLRTGENDNHYTLGNQQSFVAWLSYLLNDTVSSHLRIDAYHWSDVSGADRQLNPSLVPTGAADLRAGRRWDVSVGINSFRETGVFSDHRFTVELVKAIDQDLDGPQLGTDWMFRTSWSWVN